MKAKHHYYKTKQLKINFNESEESFLMQGELFLVQQAISNLLDNAIDFAMSESTIENRVNQKCQKSFSKYSKPRRLYTRICQRPFI